MLVVAGGHGFTKGGFNPTLKRLGEFALAFSELLEVIAEVLFGHLFSPVWGCFLVTSSLYACVQFRVNA